MIPPHKWLGLLVLQTRYYCLLFALARELLTLVFSIRRFWQSFEKATDALDAALAVSLPDEGSSTPDSLELPAPIAQRLAGSSRPVNGAIEDNTNSEEAAKPAKRTRKKAPAKTKAKAKK